MKDVRRVLSLVNEGRALLALIRDDGKASVFLKERDGESERLRLFIFPDLRSLSSTFLELGGRYPTVFPLPFCGFAYIFENKWQIKRFAKLARHYEVVPDAKPLHLF
ncbi:MAG: hypothetical protein QXM08_04055 [Thermofilaceae archaeon]